MKKLILVLISIGSLSIYCFGQYSGEEYTKAEIFGGYSNSTDFDVLDDQKPVKIQHGFNVAGVYNLRKYVGLKVDVSGTYGRVDGYYYYPGKFFAKTTTKGSQSVYTVSAGVQIKNNDQDQAFKPFGHVLVGYGQNQYRFKNACPSGAICPIEQTDTEGVSLIIGGGLDIKVNNRIDIRAVQFDINPITSTTKTANRYDGYYNSRFSSGIIFKF